MTDTESTRAERELEQLAYAASHDLKEPLRAITGYLRLLDGRYSATLDDDARRFIAGAVEGAERMDAMVTGLLNYSRAGRAPLVMCDVDTAAVVEEAADSLRRSGELNGARVSVGPLPVVRGDRDQLRALFGELLANALKFRSADEPEVAVDAQQCDDGWEISMTDNGIGIDPANAERIFHVFKRLHTRGEYEGTGMGLAISRTVAERHGGTITVEPAAAGSRFVVTLPG